MRISLDSSDDDSNRRSYNRHRRRSLPRYSFSPEPQHRQRQEYEDIQGLTSEGKRRRDRREEEYKGSRRSGERYYEGRHDYSRDQRHHGRDWNSPPPEHEQRHKRDVPKVKDEREVKQKIRLDQSGRLVGKMTKNFHDDIVAFVRELDPNGNWDKQTQEGKDALEKRIYKEWDIVGPISEISQKYLKSECNQALINHRFQIGKLIKAGKPMPKYMDPQHWERMVETRRTKAWKAKSKTMTNIAQKRGFRNSTRLKVEKSARLQLVCYLLQSESLP
jgi:hypothetical protein